jgi:hypothetical protein
MNDLRDALVDAPTRKDGTIVGPYNIYPFKSVIGCYSVRQRFAWSLDLLMISIWIGSPYHSKTATPLDKPRPRVGLDFYRMADLVLERVRSGQTSFERVVDRLQECNPTLSVRVKKDGSIGRDELAYCLVVNACEH